MSIVKNLRQENLKQFEYVYLRAFPEKSFSGLLGSIKNGVCDAKFEFSGDDLASFVIYQNLGNSEIEILDIATADKHKKKGFAQKLLNSFSTYNKIFLEVRRDNKAALSLYCKCGFKKTGIRKNYYKTEGNYIDAVLMEKLL